MNVRERDAHRPISIHQVILEGLVRRLDPRPAVNGMTGVEPIQCPLHHLELDLEIIDGRPEQIDALPHATRHPTKAIRDTVRAHRDRGFLSCPCYEGGR